MQTTAIFSLAVRAVFTTAATATWAVLHDALSPSAGRIFAGPLAGMHRMRWAPFAAANALGAAVWVAAVTAVGVLVGNNLDRASNLVSRAGYTGLAIAVAIALVWAVWHIGRRLREAQPGPASQARQEAAPSDLEKAADLDHCGRPR